MVQFTGEQMGTPDGEFELAVEKRIFPFILVFAEPAIGKVMGCNSFPMSDCLLNVVYCLLNVFYHNRQVEPSVSIIFKRYSTLCFYLEAY